MYVNILEVHRVQGEKSAERSEIPRGFCTVVALSRSRRCFNKSRDAVCNVKQLKPEKDEERKRRRKRVTLDLDATRRRLRLRVSSSEPLLSFPRLVINGRHAYPRQTRLRNQPLSLGYFPANFRPTRGFLPVFFFYLDTIDRQRIIKEGIRK